VSGGSLVTGTGALAATASITVNTATLASGELQRKRTPDCERQRLCNSQRNGFDLAAVTNANTATNAINFLGSSGTLTWQA
jgi:hypothetical protein